MVRGLHAPARAGLRALGRVVEGRQPRRRPLRDPAGPRLLRRVDVLARDGRLEGGAREARRARARAGRARDRLPAGHAATSPPWARARSRGANSRSCWPSRYNIPRPAAAGLPPRKHGEAQRPPDSEPAVLRDGALPVQLPAGAARALAGGHAQLPHRHGDLRRTRLRGLPPLAAPSPTAPTATTARPACRCAWSPAQFEPTRSQRRAWKRHAALVARYGELKFNAEHYALYRLYQGERHRGGGMDHDSREQYAHFLLQSNVATRLVEFREDGQAAHGVHRGRAGRRPVLRLHLLRPARAEGELRHLEHPLADRARPGSRGLPYVYLGYWIAQSRKMAYKSEFRPIEGLSRGEWKRLR